LATGITYFYKQLIYLKPEIFPNLVLASKKTHFLHYKERRGLGWASGSYGYHCVAKVLRCSSYRRL